MIGIRSYKRGFWKNEAKFTNVFKERRSPLVGRLHAERPPIGRRTRARDEEAADGADCADEAERGRGFGASIAATGGPYVALLIFLAFYVTCLALNWWYYMRKSTVLGKARV
jgi:hypothetical protein